MSYDCIDSRIKIGVWQLFSNSHHAFRDHDLEFEKKSIKNLGREQYCRANRDNKSLVYCPF